MNKNQEHSFLTNYTPATLPPAQLFIGNHDQTMTAVESLLQKMLCTHNACGTCMSCMRIREHQHHAIMWLHPEKNYTIEQFDDLFSTLSLQLQPNELFFFVIQKADFLTTSCANKLLKSMEEPPRGYHFILLAERQEQIIPTIISRCILHTLHTSITPDISHPLFEVFTKKITTGSNFSRIIDNANLNERESIELLDQIIHYWFNEYEKQSTPCITTIICKLQKISLQPPMPGSSITFWRNAYLQLNDSLATILQ
jgi:DNA polymerase III gamma/tau subunit